MKIEIEKKIFEKIIKNHANFAAQGTSCLNVLENICVRYSNGFLEFATTNGAKLLVTKIKANNKKDFGPFIYDLKLLNNVKFSKNYKKTIDNLFINLNEKEMQIKDSAYGTTLKVPSIEAAFPRYYDLPKVYDFSEEKYKKVILNKDFLKDLTSMLTNDRLNMIDISFPIEGNLKPVLINCEDEENEIKQFALLMQIQKEE